MCNHEKVTFAGVQETLNPDKPIMLFKCLICESTITLKKISNIEIILDKNKAKLHKNNIITSN